MIRNDCLLPCGLSSLVIYPFSQQFFSLSFHHCHNNNDNNNNGDKNNIKYFLFY